VKGGGGGKDSVVKRSGMLVVLLYRGFNYRLRPHLGCSERNITIFGHQVVLKDYTQRNKETLLGPFLGAK